MIATNNDVDCWTEGNNGERTMSTATMDKPTTVERWYTVTEVMGMTGFGRTFLYGQMVTGRLRSKKVSGSRRIPESAVVEWQSKFDSHGDIQPQ
jgi:hypothetical protein